MEIWFGLVWVWVGVRVRGDKGRWGNSGYDGKM